MSDDKIKLKRLAELANVSPTTASIAFSGNGRISNKTKKHILKTAEDIGYKHPVKNKGNNKKLVALLISIDKDHSNLWHFLTDMISQLEVELSKLDLNFALIPVDQKSSNTEIFNKIIKLECRAIFSVHYANEELINRLEESKIPVILLMNNTYQDKYFSICFDDFKGAYEGTKYLLSLGHKKIYFVDDVREDLPTLSSDRYFGYRKALQEGRIPFLEEFKITCRNADYKSDVGTIKNVLQQDYPPTAFFCLDDEVALRLYNALFSLGYKVPDDISIIAPGDLLDYTKPYIPQITTMKLNLINLSTQAVYMLNNRLNSSAEINHVISIIPQLVTRESCMKYKN